MPRSVNSYEPIVINNVKETSQKDNPLNFAVYATSNAHKLEEIRRILFDYEIIGKDLNVEEVQSLDPYKVVSEEAKEAWRKNGYNPIIVEDTSLDILALGNRPGTYVKDFTQEVEMRKQIVDNWLGGNGSAAVARVLLAVYDGRDVYIREGKISGKIAKKLRGTNGFGWDDMFIPDGQKPNEEKTFAEMESVEKDKYSMRRLALENLLQDPFPFLSPVFMLPEPFEQELLRVDLAKLTNEKAKIFAYSLESLGPENPINNDFTASVFTAIQKSANPFYTHYLSHTDQKDLGLLLTDVDRTNIKCYPNGEPVIWQMGPERRHLALVERADFYIRNQQAKIHQILDDLEAGISNYPTRRRGSSKVVDRVLGLKEDDIITRTHALNELGYKKIDSEKYVSRSAIAENGLYTKIGKYARSIFGLGSMPQVTGRRDMLVTAAIAHMPCFTTRSNIFAVDVQTQIDLINDAKNTLNRLLLGGNALLRAERNIGAAIGAGNIEEELSSVRRLYHDAGVRMFRIYTINSDPRVIEIARKIRSEFGNKVEIFVGQIVTKEQALKLIAPDIRADALIFGHGGGRQCTSATNGMAVTTLEELYGLITDSRFDATTLLVEGGVGTSVGALLIFGVNGILYNQQISRCTIETGDFYFEHKSGGICEPYHGSASAPTMIIESFNPKIRAKRMLASGRVLNVEGKPGYAFYSEKANSATFYIDTFRHYAARTLADMGVETIAELIQKINSSKVDHLRIVSTEAKFIGSPYGAQKN